MDGWIWLRLAAISGFVGVAVGAFGAHGLKGRFAPAEGDPFATTVAKQRAIENFETAARYQMYHALALAVVGLLALAGHGHANALAVAGWGFVAGTLLFSGSLYAFVLTGQRWLVALTPVGGLSFLVGWAALAIAARKP